MEKITKEQYQNAYKICLAYKEQVEAELVEITQPFGEVYVKDTEISFKLLKALRLNLPNKLYINSYNIKLSDVKKMKLSDIIATRNFNKKMLTELELWCEKNNVQIKY